MKTEAEVEETIAEIKKTERKAMFKVFNILPWGLLIISIIFSLGFKMNQLGKDKKALLEEAIRIDSERNELISEAIEKGYGEMGNRGFHWVIFKCPECPLCPSNSPITNSVMQLITDTNKAHEVKAKDIKTNKTNKVVKATKSTKPIKKAIKTGVEKVGKEGEIRARVEKGYLVGQNGKEEREEVVHRIVESYNGKIIDLNKFEEELNNGLQELEENAKDESKGKLQEM